MNRERLRRSVFLLVALLSALPMIVHAQQAQITPLSNSVLQGNAVTFDASNSSGTISTYHWDFDDGTTATGRTVTKTFGTAGIYQVTLTVSNSIGSNSCSALLRVHTPATVRVPQVLLDTDARNEQDDQHYMAYALFSELDVLGINSVHHNRWADETETQLVPAHSHWRGGLQSEQWNYDEIIKVLDLAKGSGLPDARVPRVFRGATEPLKTPSSKKWHDTKFIVTEASNAILAAARGASLDNPVWVLPAGPATNVAAAVLQARQEGWETEFRKRIRIHWIGGSESNIQADFNGRNDPWSPHVVYASGIEFLVLSAPATRSITVDKRVDGHRYPNNPLGDYLKSIMPDRNKILWDLGLISDIISMHLEKSWIRRVEPGILVNTYEYQTTTTPTNLNVVFEVDHEAIVNDFFNTLNGNPSKLIDAAATVPQRLEQLSASAFNSAQINLQINLSWADNSGNETGFRIDRRTGTGGSWGLIATVGANVRGYSDTTGLAAGTTYYYRMRANNNAGNSSYSNEASAALHLK